MVCTPSRMPPLLRELERAHRVLEPEALVERRVVEDTVEVASEPAEEEDRPRSRPVRSYDRPRRGCHPPKSRDNRRRR